MVGESNAGSRQCRLRVTTDQPAGDVAMTVQLNGHGLGGGSAASTTQLFDEPYDQTVPNAARSRDFEVDGSELIYGENEVVVLAAAPLKITNVELAVTG